jgi:hypothetical protein
MQNPSEPPYNPLQNPPPGQPEGQAQNPPPYQPQGQPPYQPQNPPPYQPQGQQQYQPPFQPGMNPAPFNAPRKKSPLKMVALGCGLPVLGLLIIGALFGDSKSSKSTSAAPANALAYGSPAYTKYTGKWQGSDGTSMWIRGDGKGDYNGGSLKVTGGGVTVDEKAKTLAITSFFNIGKTWRIEKPPAGSDAGAKMTLDNTVYTRTSGGD